MEDSSKSILVRGAINDFIVKFVELSAINPRYHEDSYARPWHDWAFVNPVQGSFHRRYPVAVKKTRFKAKGAVQI